ncbi:MaoC family dehydratase [Chelativorans sp. YIM 93263]|uniref:MaoC family dehydratase n=1 Tax=Chelativorans sp. YIM 93263 TaxID=2906648 RepID=UPI0023795DF9|nr:MaoC family dehydratase [Chelativorans sp. YIM 93263]
MTALEHDYAVTAVLDDNPGYKGSVHEDSVARAQGFRAALIPGAFVYDYATRLATRAWGVEWLARGAIAARFRRPVYDGDELVVKATPAGTFEGGPKVDVTITNAEGEQVLVGWMALADSPPSVPAVEALAFHPFATPKPELRVEDLAHGLEFGTEDRVLTAQDIADSRTAMGNTEAIYDDGLAHSACMVRLTMRDVLTSYKFPLAPVFTEVETRNCAPLKAGRRIQTAAQILDVFESNGRHYFKSEEYLVADGTEIVARHIRTNLIAG